MSSFYAKYGILYKMGEGPHGNVFVCMDLSSKIRVVLKQSGKWTYKMRGHWNASPVGNFLSRRIFAPSSPHLERERLEYRYHRHEAAFTAKQIYHPFTLFPIVWAKTGPSTRQDATEGVPQRAIREASFLRILIESNHIVKLLDAEPVDQDGKTYLYMVRFVRSVVACPCFGTLFAARAARSKPRSKGSLISC